MSSHTVSSTTILVVDDNEANRYATRRILRQAGYGVVDAASGEEGLRLAQASPQPDLIILDVRLQVVREFRPELVLLDIGMPGMNGFEVARRLRQEHGPSGMALVALTGYGQTQDREATREAGFDAHLVKPVELNALRDLLVRTVS